MLGIIALFHPSYVIQTWHVTVGCIGLTALGVVANYAIHAFRLLESLILFISIAGFIAYVVVLLVLGPRVDVYDTFFDFQDTQGWGSKGLAALVGILGPVVTLIGADSTSHLAEETVGARKIVPRAMFVSIAISYSFGFVMHVVIMVVSTGYSQDLATQTGNAGIAIIYNATRSYVGAEVMCIILFLLLFWALTNQIMGASRVTWAFARDGGLPGHRWLSKVWSHYVTQELLRVPLTLTSFRSTVATCPTMQS
jgi:choline transport protein